MRNLWLNIGSAAKNVQTPRDGACAARSLANAQQRTLFASITRASRGTPLSNKTTVQAMLRDSLMSFALPGDISSLCELLCFSRPRRAKINAGAESE